MNLSTRIVVLAVGLIGAVGLFVGGFTVAVSHRLVDEASSRKTEELTDTLVALARPDLYNLRVDRINATIEHLLAQPSVDGLFIYGSDGLLLADGAAYPNLSYIQSESSEVRDAILSGTPQSFTTDDQRISIQPVRSPSGRTMGMAVVKLSRAQEHFWIDRRRYQIVIFIGLLTIVGGLAAAHFSSSLTRPLEVLTSTLESPEGVFDDAFHEVETRDDEIGQMARTYRRVETSRIEHERELLASKQALEKAKVEAEAATRAKSDFLANMSHEIRTPLNGLMGLTEILLKEDPRPDQKSLLETAASCGESLLRIVNDLLDFSKIEAGRIRMNPEPTDLVKIAEDSLKLFESRLQERSLGNRLELQDGFPRSTLIDGQRVRQVMQNLIGNAIKFTEKGSIVLKLGFEPCGNNSVNLIGAVTDTGCGIDPAHLERIFERFAQADESAARRHGGTGLGLAICHRLVTLMNGQLSVESAVGKGSTFTFRIPSHVIPESRSNTAPSVPQESAPRYEFGPILVVEDNPVNRRVVKLMLKHLGQESVLVASGQAALEAVEQESYEVILMDVQMPGMDGFETTRRLRERCTTRDLPQPHIVALTAYAQESDRIQCIKNGMDDFITKPLKRGDLQSLFSRLAEQKHRADRDENSASAFA